jgi:DNA-binding beta-propeller fold protein YncE
MDGSPVDRFARALWSGGIARRTLARGLAGMVLAAGFANLDGEDADGKRGRKNAKKRRKGKKRRGGGDDGGGGDGGDGGGGGNEPCPFTNCDGQCVDLESDNANCGACGRACVGDSICVGGFCAFAQGSEGDGITQFDNPIGIAVNADGIYFVADANNRRVSRLQAGAFQGAIGEAGEGNGQFLRPAGVAVNQGTGDLYVVDFDRHRVQRFGRPEVRDEFEIGFGTFGGGVDQFEFPIGIAIDEATGQVFVADTGNSRIQRMSADGFPLGRFGRNGSAEGEFDQPLGIAIDRNRNVVVADTQNHRIQILDQDGNVVRVFGREGSGEGEFINPVAVAFDSTEDIYVVDQGNDRIQQFSSDGQFRKAFGREGRDVGEFQGPFGIAIDFRDIVAVVDLVNDRVQFFIPPSVAAEDARTLMGGGRR